MPFFAALSAAACVFSVCVCVCALRCTSAHVIHAALTQHTVKTVTIFPQHLLFYSHLISYQPSDTSLYMKGDIFPNIWVGGICSRRQVASDKVTAHLAEDCICSHSAVGSVSAHTVHDKYMHELSCAYIWMVECTG